MILERLRHDTRDAHQRLERHLDLLTPALTIDRYGRLLRCLLGLYRPWEARLATVLGDDPLLALPRAPELVRDLDSLGLDAAVPDWPELPPLGRRAEALGALYVTEGSRLGGQVIARHAAHLFGWPPGHATRFFTSGGGDVGAIWRSLRAALAAADPAEADAMADAARHTFALFERRLPQAPTAAASP